MFLEPTTFDEETIKNLEQLPCCRPFEGKDLEYCSHCSCTKIVPTDWIIQYFNEAGERIDQVGRCSVHVLSYIGNPFDADDEDSSAFQFLPLQDSVEKVVIIRRTRSAS